MPEYVIVHDAGREKGSRGRKAYTFTIDGQQSLYWAAKKEHVERVVNRLRMGRSGEAFGGAGVVSLDGQPAAKALTKGHGPKARGKVVSAGEVTVETVVMKSGREKPREKRPGFLYELDGVAHEKKIVTSKAEAEHLCASHAFATRGKLGRFAEAEAAFKDQTGKECKIHVLDLPGSALHYKVVAKDQDGGLWHVGFNAGVNGDRIKFVLVVPAPPK